MKNVPVTQAHMDAALAILAPTGFVTMFPGLERTAQLIANLSSQLQRKAWAEGYEAKAQCRSQDANPYPKLDP